MKLLSDWLDIMLGEIARKREEAARGELETETRERESESRAAPAARESVPESPRFSATLR
jgi:hypothetical protein